MDYEKKYKEALKRAEKQLETAKVFDYGDGQIAHDIRTTVSEIFPELRESEDERIRKDIIGGLMWQRDNLKSEGPHDNNLILPGFCFAVGKHLAYLEKQKEEEGYEAIPVKSTLEYKLGFADGRDYEKQKEPHYTKRNALFDKCVENCDPEVMKEVSDKVDEMLGKERKPSCWNSPVMTHEMIMDEQKPVEWSEEDEKMRLDTIRAFYLAYPYALENPRRKNIDWLKSLPERFNLQPKQEWSEEEFGMLFDIEHYLDGTLQLTPDRKIKCIGFLKALRPQPHTVSIKDATKFGNLEYERGVKDGIQSEKSRQWKPSEEQMDAIDRCVDYLEESDNEDAEIMESLQEQLHKLM